MSTFTATICMCSIQSSLGQYLSAVWSTKFPESNVDCVVYKGPWVKYQLFSQQRTLVKCLMFGLQRPWVPCLLFGLRKPLGQMSTVKSIKGPGQMSNVWFLKAPGSHVNCLRFCLICLYAFLSIPLSILL